MALVKAEDINTQFKNMSHLPMLRQLGLLIGLAASIALGVAVVLWSQTPNYSPVFNGLSGTDASAVMSALQRDNIPYKLEAGTLMVPASKLNEVRLKLAGEGLPHGTNTGFELLSKQQGFGTSQFIERARYQHAMEGELARTIASINAVENARVHLAVPRESVFIRASKKPSASVMVELYPGRSLDAGQVTAIMHLVASSVPNLDADGVTVVDQRGQLLTPDESPHSMALSNTQFKYTRKIEQAYSRKILNLLSPLVGRNNVRAQVVADMDFTQSEQTREVYNPNSLAVRSEQRFDEQVPVGSGVGGVPGALSNEPPGAGTAPQQVTPPASAGNTNAANAGTNAQPKPAGSTNASKKITRTPYKTTKRSTINYELDKTISHTRRPSGVLQRLSVAVVVNDTQSVNAKGKRVDTPLAPKELSRIAQLVKDAVGYNVQRGDTVNVINAAFKAPTMVAPLPKPPIWKQPWVWSIGKQLLGALAVILLVFGVLRPVMRGLATRPVHTVAKDEAQEDMAEDQLTLSDGTQQRLPAPNGQYENALEMAKAAVGDDPRRVAQVVKTWVASEV